MLLGLDWHFLLSLCLAYIAYLLSFTMCLLLTDGRTLVDHARIEAQNHRFTFDEVYMCINLNCFILILNYSIRC